MSPYSWQHKAAAKKAHAAAKIPPEWQLSAECLQRLDEGVLQPLGVPEASGILSLDELKITETVDATELRNQLACGELTAVAVTTAFCKRAAIAQQLTSCLTETIFPQALERAKSLDDHLRATRMPMGPLHGLPISLKESFNIKGVPSSLGMVSFLDRDDAAQNSVLVDILLEAGAVLYVKTNVPQTMMTPDSHNNVFGRVLNPHRRNLTAGGSSGGEGALVALRGSILGIGTDIAGSVRIPALCCGVRGFKPTVGRIPYAGQASVGRPGMTGIAPVAGPLCHSIRDAELLLRVVFAAPADDMDDMALGLQWTEQPTPEPSTLTIGLLPEDPGAPLHPNMRRVLDKAVRTLSEAGHRVIDLSEQVDFLSEATEVSMRYFNLDPDQTQLNHVAASGEPAVPSLRFTFDVDSEKPEATLRELFDLNTRRSQLMAKMRRIYVGFELDVIIGPAFQSCAVPHDTYGFPIYTVLANLVDVSITDVV